LYLRVVHGVMESICARCLFEINKADRNLVPLNRGVDMRTFVPVEQPTY